MIDYIVTCCTKNDLKVFLKSLHYIKKYIQYQNLILTVPDKDFDLFKNNIDLQKFSILLKKDSDVILQNESNIVKSILSEKGFSFMYGWYIQQFIKIRISSEFNDKKILIWDSDTIPLRPLNFFLKDKIIYFTGTEYHEPYFITLNRILNISKQIPNSFIAQCFPFYSFMSKDMINDLGGDQKFIKKIMNNISSSISFSEYETLGNYFLYKYPDSFEPNYSPWLRDGYKRFFFNRGKLDSTINSLQFKYSFVSFEKLDRSKFKYIFNYFYNKLRSIINKF